MIFINYFRLAQNNKEFEFKDLLKIKKQNLRSLTYLGLICLFYSLFISLILSPDLKDIIALANESEMKGNIYNNAVGIITKFVILALPILMATWFSPILISYHNFGLIKAIKSSFAGVLVSIVPILIAWIILLGVLFH